MPSQTEGRLSLALEAYHRRMFTSLRSAAKAYDVPFKTLYDRYYGILARAQTTANSRKLTETDEALLLQKVLDLVTQGLHPQCIIVEEMANTIL